MESLTTDPEAYGATLAENLLRSDEYWESRLRNGLLDAPRVLFFAVEDGNPVGMVACMPTERERTAHVISMYVARPYRGQGLARQLLERLIEELKQSGGVDTLELEANPLQIPAVTLYRSLGFEVYATDEVVRSDGSRLTELMMRRTV
ncbi:hypothetical protein BH11ARM2_BH11ARM2_28760 [soil metagenome]